MESHGTVLYELGRVSADLNDNDARALLKLIREADPPMTTRAAVAAIRQWRIGRPPRRSLGWIYRGIVKLPGRLRSNRRTTGRDASSVAIRPLPRGTDEDLDIVPGSGLGSESLTLPPARLPKAHHGHRIEACGFPDEVHWCDAGGTGCGANRFWIRWSLRSEAKSSAPAAGSLGTGGGCVP